jgi:hypothetical protein
MTGELLQIPPCISAVRVMAGAFMTFAAGDAGRTAGRPVTVYSLALVVGADEGSRILTYIDGALFQRNLYPHAGRGPGRGFGLRGDAEPPCAGRWRRAFELSGCITLLKRVRKGLAGEEKSSDRRSSRCFRCGVFPPLPRGPPQPQADQNVLNGRENGSLKDCLSEKRTVR